MSDHVLSSKEGTKLAMTGFWVLLVITIGEVLLALVGNGHIIKGFEITRWIMVPVMCLLSLYKAYYIVSIFMHLGGETRAMAASVVLPVLLLVWGIIAFLWEGSAWRNSKNVIRDKNLESIKPSGKTSYNLELKETHQLVNGIYFS